MLKYLNPSYYLRTAQRGGYTIDQTILIVVIIAILITLVIITIGWQLIGRATGTKLGSQFKQIEDAAGQFYSSHKTWPHLAAPTITDLQIPLVLSGLSTISGVSLTVDTTKMENFLPGLKINGTTSVQSSYGTAIRMRSGTVAALTGAPATQMYNVVLFSNVPIADAIEADEAIDGEQDSTSGRLIYRSSDATVAGCLGSSTMGAAVPAPAVIAAGTKTVTTCYVANAI